MLLSLRSPVSCSCPSSFLPLFNLPCASSLSRFHSTRVHISPHRCSALPPLLSPTLSANTFSLKQSFRLLFFLTPWDIFTWCIIGTSHSNMSVKRFVFSRLFILWSCHPRKCNSILLVGAGPLESCLTCISYMLNIYFNRRSSWLRLSEYIQNSPTSRAVTIPSKPQFLFFIVNCGHIVVYARGPGLAAITETS